MSKYNICVLCFPADGTAIAPAELPESSHTDARATDQAVAFTVLGEVKPRTLKKVHKINQLLFTEIYFCRRSLMCLSIQAV